MRLQPIALASLSVPAVEGGVRSPTTIWPYPVFLCAPVVEERTTAPQRRPAGVTPHTYNKGFSAFDW
jgi:hypothetical protein